MIRKPIWFTYKLSTLMSKTYQTELLPKMGMDLKLVQLVAYTDWKETQEKDAKR